MRQVRVRYTVSTLSTQVQTGHTRSDPRESEPSELRRELGTPPCQSPPEAPGIAAALDVAADEEPIP